MSYDAHANLAYATVAVAPSPAASGTSLTVGAGKGSLFPTAPFNCTVYPSGTPPLASNAEIVRVTNVVGDVFTIVRAQEGTTAKNIATGWQIANTATKLVFTDIENSIIQFISAGTTKASASEVVFANSNGVSFGADGQSITASVAAAAQSTQPVAASASNGSFLFSTLGFSNANGVTFGTSGGSIITASVNTAAGVGGVAISGGTSLQSTGTVVFSNSNGVTFGLDNGTLTASVNTGGGLTTQSAQIASASNGSFTFETLKFSNKGVMVMGTSSDAGGPVIYASQSGGYYGSISAGTTNASLGEVVFSNSNGISFGMSVGSVTASHNGLTSQSNQAASASNGSFTFQTLNFSDANGVTFGTSAGGIVTASVNAAAGGSINFSAGTQSSNLASVVFSDSNGVTFGLSNGTITASASGGGGGGGTIYSYQNINMGLGTRVTIGNEQGSYCIYFNLPGEARFNHLQIAVSGNPATTAVTANGSAASESNSSARATMVHFVRAVIYSHGTGASSGSLFSVASGQNTHAYEVTFQNGAGSAYSTTQAWTFPLNSTYLTGSNSTALTSATASMRTAAWGGVVNAYRMYPIPISTTLPAGNYCALIGWTSSNTVTADIARFSVITANNAKFVGSYGVLQLNSQLLPYGAVNNTAASFGYGTYTNAGWATTNELNTTQISSVSSQPAVLFQLTNF